ncbi:MAG TPA: helix-turn-helix domain-containing protein [Pseudonocardiaceae bacterium]|jgi:DNA invertase Pin-like site-specific DNA recombinase|nr:helix-turn-helix domain-containing protein [Pseudonocardiaceae bacterium]
MGRNVLTPAIARVFAGLDTTTRAARLANTVAIAHVLPVTSNATSSARPKPCANARTPAGVVARGRRGGRRPKLSERQIALARQMHASREHTVAAIAETFGVTRPTIYRALGASS